MSFSYSTVEVSPSLPLASFIGLHLIEDELNAVFLEPSLDLKWAMGQMDALYLKPDYSQVVLLKTGVTPIFKDRVHSSLNKGLIKIGGGFLYHGKTPGGFGYALFFKGFSEQKISTILNKITTVLAHSSFSKIHDEAKQLRLPHLISPAYAEDCIQNFWEGISSTRGIQDVLRNISAHPTAKFAVGCILGVFKGVWNASGGVVEDAAHLVKEMHDPQKAAKKLWENTGKTVDAMRAFFKDFSFLAKEIYPGLMNMDSKIVGDLICETAATVGTASLLVYLTSGIGSPNSISAIAKSLGKLENSDKFGATLKAAKASTGPVSPPKNNLSTPRVAPRENPIKVSEPTPDLTAVKVPVASQTVELDLLIKKLSQPSPDLTPLDIENVKKWATLQSKTSSFHSSEEKQRFQSFAEALRKAQEAYRRNAYPNSPKYPLAQEMELLNLMLDMTPRTFMPKQGTPARKVRNPNKAAEAYSEWQ